MRLCRREADNPVKRSARRWFRSAGWAVLALLAAGGVAWAVAPWCVDDPLPLLEARRPARIWADRNGLPLYAERGWDAQWRFPVPLERISPEAIEATLLAEDAHFYGHGGVDWGAVLRAAWQNATSCRVVSGASTLSMQVANLATGRRRTLWGKFLQAARARRMERLHSKAEILSAYLNHVSYGGKLHGIEAAARFYFGVAAADLSFAEATLLCGVPQRPNALRPDRFPEAARQRQRRLLEMMARRGRLTPEQAEACRFSAPARLRDFSRPAPFERLARRDENLHALKRGFPVDATLQQQALAVLRRQRDSLSGVADAACVAIVHGAGGAREVMLYVGTLDFNRPGDGQVDAACRPRSAGSVLKPFLYAEAIEGGLVVPATKLLDAPVRYGAYAPANCEAGNYAGAVDAGAALASSLNTPAVRLLAMLGAPRMVRRLRSLGLPATQESGLTLVLGTDGAALLPLVRAYDALPEAFSPETAALVASMLRRPLPRCTLDVAWKTGTANNNTDAWCVAWTPEMTVGVWFGNKSGRRSPDLAGLSAAAPAAGEIISLLYAHRPPPQWEEPTHMETLCAASGLAAGPACRQTVRGLAHPALPLRRCEGCAVGVEPLRILSPKPLVYVGDAATVLLSANRPSVRWFEGGMEISGCEGTFGVGRHTLRAFAGDESAAVEFAVVPKP